MTIFARIENGAMAEPISLSEDQCHPARVERLTCAYAEIFDLVPADFVKLVQAPDLTHTHIS